MNRSTMTRHTAAAALMPGLALALVLAMLSAPAAADGDGYESPLSYRGYDLIWQDEFDGDALDPASWNVQLGDGCPELCGWGNQELQYYQAENVSVADGVLTIEARVESAGGKPYTSGRVNTEGKRFFKYGRVDIRAKMPRGRGPWPALWMLGENHAEVGWPRCGEIDIVEKTGRNERKALGTAHWYHDTPEPGNNASYGGHTSITSGDLADEFHVYSVVWDKRKIRWYLDGARKPYHEIDIKPKELDEFREEFFVLLNLAVGGSLGGRPDDAVFPQRLVVDYIRVFQR